MAPITINTLDHSNSLHSNSVSIGLKGISVLKKKVMKQVNLTMYNVDCLFQG